jgi:NADH-quinone oxidoreductase subunit C
VRAGAVVAEVLAGADAVAASDGTPAFEVPAERIHEVCQALRERAGFDYVTFITAVDHMPREPRFEVVYQLRSLQSREECRLRVRLPEDRPHLASVIDLWTGADWLEREVWDLYGIVFEGHPRLRRLILPEDFPGHPLRRDEPLGGEEVEFSQERPW